MGSRWSGGLPATVRGHAAPWLASPPKARGAGARPGPSPRARWRRAGQARGAVHGPRRGGAPGKVETIRGVQIGPGATALTRMPLDTARLASARVMTIWTGGGAAGGVWWGG